MVGIFLRLLEYHQGVLFLTTNRVKSFDSAFHSRISVALKYPDLDVAQRQQVHALACVHVLCCHRLLTRNHACAHTGVEQPPSGSRD